MQSVVVVNRVSLGSREPFFFFRRADAEFIRWPENIIVDKNLGAFSHSIYHE